MKTGRNDPCPCGSGKKHKHCCLKDQVAQHSATDLVWRRLRRELEGQPERMLRFVCEVYGPLALEEAWEEFVVWDENAPDFEPSDPHMQLFMPCMLHSWSPNPDETEVINPDLVGVAPTQAFLDRKGRQLASTTRDYLQSCLQRAFSFYEVEDCVPGRSICLRDMLIGDRYEVRDQSASKVLRPHEVIFALLATVDGVTLLEATSPISLPASDQLPIIDMRQQMAEQDFDGDAIEPFVSAQIVKDCDMELRELYLELAAFHLNPPMPEMRTSDGERVEFHTLAYDIDSAELAFNALKHLGDESDQAGAHAQRDVDGQLLRTNIHWLAPESHGGARTMLGLIHIDGARMFAEVNSIERADRLKSIIADLLGSHVTFRVDSIEAIESMMDDETVPSIATNMDKDDPALQRALATYLHRHYQQWIDHRIPALGNRTPREMVSSTDGRERVAALLHDAELHDMGLSAAARKAIFDGVREQLGLMR